MEIGKTFCGRTYGHTWVPVYKVIGRRWPKNGTTIFAYNFVKCQPIFKILSLTDLALNLLTPRTSRLDRFFWASPIFGFSFFIILFCSVPCGRLSWLLVSFWAHINIVNRIISYLTSNASLHYLVKSLCPKIAMTWSCVNKIAMQDSAIQNICWKIFTQ